MSRPPCLECDGRGYVQPYPDEPWVDRICDGCGGEGIRRAEPSEGDLEQQAQEDVLWPWLGEESEP